MQSVTSVTQSSGSLAIAREPFLLSESSCLVFVLAIFASAGFARLRVISPMDLSQFDQHE